MMSADKIDLFDSIGQKVKASINKLISLILVLKFGFCSMNELSEIN